MPPEAPNTFDARLASLAAALDLDLPPQLRAHLLQYMTLIERWTRIYNLTAVREPAAMFTHHLLDCLAIVAPLRRRLAAPMGSSRQVLDVGSGAGLPGMVLALLQPEWQVTCVDAVAKKTTFIRQAATEIGLTNLRAVHARVEAPGALGAIRYDLIVSRAFASLREFTSLTRPLLAPQGQWVAMKAHLTDAERGELPSDIELFHVEQLHVPELDAARCLAWLRPSNTLPQPVPEPRQ